MRPQIQRPLAALDLFASIPSTHHPSSCRSCLRQFATTAAVQAGHNKWSKTKHIKAVTDRKKTADRDFAVKNITLFSKLYGDDIKFNPSLNNAITRAKQASVPKALIDAAIARGQGRSVDGKKLEPVIIEALRPPNIAILVEAVTDSKTRTVADFRHALKKRAPMSSTAFYFTKRGRVVFLSKEDGPDVQTLLDEAIEQEGVEDIEELPDGSILLWTTTTQVAAITDTFGRKDGVEVLESDIVYDPNEDTMENVDDSGLAESLEKLLSDIREFAEVKAVYANVRQGAISDEEWHAIQRHLDV